MNIQKIVIAPLCAFALLVPTMLQAQAGHLTWPKGKITAPKGAQPNGEQPLAGAHVYVYSIGMTKPNSAPTSLISDNGSQTVGTDALGNEYVYTDVNGNFSVTGEYYDQCNADTDIVYIVADQGQSGGQYSNNPQTALVAMLPYDCGDLNNLQPTVYVSTLTTAAAAYAMQSFANSFNIQPVDGFATKVSSSVTVNAVAFNTAITASQNLVSTLGGGYSISDAGTQKLINTAADVISACINSDGGTFSSTPCGQLFEYTTPASESPVPVDTWQSLLFMTENPTGSNNANQYDLITGTPPFQPTETAAPTDWDLWTINSALPKISSLSASTGSASAQTSITISGVNLVSGTTTPTVVLDGLAATVTGTSGTSPNTSIIVTVPRTSAIGSGFIQVYPGAYASNAVPFTVTH